jgi:glutamine amidotransferase
LRFRHWLFALEGALPEFARLRPTLEAGLPDYLKRHLRTETPAEAALALFLTGLRDIGRTDDPALEPKLAAQILGRAARQLSRLSADAGASRAASFQLVCSNGQMLLAARLGGEPLHYTLLEGQDACELCGVVPGTPEQLPAARAHLRCRSVAVATHVRNGHWVELDSGQVLAVNPRAELELVPF